MLRPARPALAAAALLAVALTGCGGPPAPTAGPSTGPVADTAVSETPATTPTTTSAKPEGPPTNGLEDLAPAAASARMRHDFTRQRFLHVDGTVKSGGQTIGIKADVMAGTGARATIRMGAQTAEILQLGETVYLSGNKQFLTASAGAGAARKLKGKYMRTTASDAFYSQVKGLVTADGLTQLVPSDPLRAGRHELAGGRPVLVFAEDGGSGRFVVSDSGPAVPLSITGEDGADSVDITFSYEPFTLTAPPKSKVVKVPGS